jgi:hypothetical protein
MTQNKTCTRCKESRPITEFHKTKKSKDGLNFWCKPCRKVHGIGYRTSPQGRERINKNAAEYRKKMRSNPDYKRMLWRKGVRRLYGLSEEQFNKILEQQDHCCAICSAPQTSFARRPHVDHDHKTGFIRGLLCPRCNTALGKLDDDVQILRRAIDYLENSRCLLDGAPLRVPERFRASKRERWI